MFLYMHVGSHRGCSGSTLSARKCYAVVSLKEFPLLNRLNQQSAVAYFMSWASSLSMIRTKNGENGMQLERQKIFNWLCFFYVLISDSSACYDCWVVNWQILWNHLLVRCCLAHICMCRFMNLLWQHAASIPENGLVDCLSSVVEHYTSDSVRNPFRAWRNA
jgi:hypothetical protein